MPDSAAVAYCEVALVIWVGFPLAHLVFYLEWVNPNETVRETVMMGKIVSQQGCVAINETPLE
jgi:hypothetical protein